MPSDSRPAYTTVEELLRARLLAAIGGWRGAVESAVPTIAFVLVWTVRPDLPLALGAAAAGVVVLGVIRLLQRQTIRFLAYAAVGVAIAAVVALRSGRAQDVFLPGILTNAAYLVLMVVSVLTRWPAMGFLVGAGDPDVNPEDPFAWRRHTGVVRVASKLTWVLAGLYAARVAVMVPLYLAGQVAALGVSKILLGWPAYLVAVAVMGYFLMRGRTPLDPTLVHDLEARAGG